MMFYVNVFLLNLLADFIVCACVKKIFCLRESLFYFLLLQIPSIAATAVFLFCGLSIETFVLLKICANFLVTMLVTDSYMFKRILAIFFTFVVLEFSIFGFMEFMYLYAESLISAAFSLNLSINIKFLTIFVNICYIFAVFAIVIYLTEKIRLKSFLTKVSFDLFGKHIDFTGLIDSGNSLYDEKTSLPVVVVSLQSLSRFIPGVSIEMISKMPGARTISCVTIANEETKLWVYDVSNFLIKRGSKFERYECVVGFVARDFESHSCDCLIHKDFM